MLLFSYVSTLPAEEILRRETVATSEILGTPALEEPAFLVRIRRVLAVRRRRLHLHLDQSSVLLGCGLPSGGLVANRLCDNCGCGRGQHAQKADASAVEWHEDGHWAVVIWTLVMKRELGPRNQAPSFLACRYLVVVVELAMGVEEGVEMYLQIVSTPA